MGSLGFWRLARSDPDWIAAVDPDGTEHRAGDLLARADRLVHALRGLGLKAGDGFCGLTPNGADGLTLYLAALQAGWYYTPINWHLTGPEAAYILQDSEAKAFFADERYAEAATAAVAEAGMDPTRTVAFGDVPGFRSFADFNDGFPDTMPEDRTAGAAVRPLRPSEPREPAANCVLGHCRGMSCLTR